MFIRRKGQSFYAVENHRVNGKVRQTTVAYLGYSNNVEDAIAHCICEMELRGEPDTWDKYKSREERRAWRLGVGRLGLDFETFARKQYRKRSWRTIDKLEADAKVSREYFNWRDKGIDGFLRSQYGKYLENHRQDVAKGNARLEALWKLIPENERSAAESRVQQKVTKLQQKANETDGHLASIAQAIHALLGTKPVVHGKSGEGDNVGTTQAPGVVPECSPALRNPGTTAEVVRPSVNDGAMEGATLADVVPEMRPRRHNSGTTYSEVSQ